MSTVEVLEILATIESLVGQEMAKAQQHDSTVFRDLSQPLTFRTVDHALADLRGYVATAKGRALAQLDAEDRHVEQMALRWEETQWAKHEALSAGFGWD